MKKRSHSFLRIKTQQSEDDQLTNNNYWMGKMQPKSKQKNHLNKVVDKVTSSMIDFNKENSEININSCQSVYSDSRKTLSMKDGDFSNQEHTKQHLINVLQQKCKKYEKQLIKLYHYRNNQENQSRQKDPQNIVSVKMELQAKQSQLQQYKRLYCSKQDQIEDMNEGISSRIQRQQSEKNVLIKQINCNNIEIKRLRDELILYKGEKQTLLLVLKEKDSNIDQLKYSLGQVQTQKKKIQNYQTKLRESHSTLRQIQLQIQQYRTQMNKKDQIISESNKKVGILEQKTISHETEIKKLQQAVLSLKQISLMCSKNLEEAKLECEQWKTHYYNAKQESQTIPELQINLKNQQTTIDNITSRNKDLISMNEKLKIDLGSLKNLQKRLLEIQQSNSEYRKKLRQKQDQIDNLMGDKQLTQQYQEQIELLQSSIKQYQIKFAQKQQQKRKDKNIINQKMLAFTNLQGQLEDLLKQNCRLKQRHEKIDHIYNQNKKLNESLFVKISEIEQLQRKINVLENKNVTLANQSTKLKSFLQSRSQQLCQIQAKYQTIKNRYQTQLGCRIGLQDKCAKLAKQINNCRNRQQQLQDEIDKVNAKYEEVWEEYDRQKDSMVIQLRQLNNYRCEAEEQLGISVGRIQKLKQDVAVLKEEVREQVLKQNSHLLQIRQLENMIVSLRDQICALHRHQDDMAKYAAKIQATYQQSLLRRKSFSQK